MRMQSPGILPIAAAALLFILPSGVHAQALSVGERVRVEVPEQQRQDETRATRRLVLRGNVTRVLEDTIFLRPAGMIGEIGVPRSRTLSVRRSGGVSRRWSALRVAGLVAVSGATWVGSSYRASDLSIESRGEAIAVGAIAGAVAGALVGAALPTERWRRIER